MRKIKKLIVITFLSVILSSPFYSQGVMLVEDLTAIAAAIENGLTMYNQLMNNIQQLQKTAEQLENIKKQMQDFDLSKYDWTKWDTFLHAANDFMNLQDDMQRLIDSKSMQIGKYRFSLRDLYTTDFYLNTMTEAEKNLNPKNISKAEQAAFISRHGMTVEHYNKFLALEHEIATKSAEVVVTVENAKKVTKALNKQMIDMGVETDSQKSAEDLQVQYANGELQNTIVQTEIQISMLQSLQNLSQHILEEHKLTREYVEASNGALERYNAIHNKEDIGNDKEYLHLWGGSKAKVMTDFPN